MEKFEQGTEMEIPRNYGGVDFENGALGITDRK